MMKAEQLAKLSELLSLRLCVLCAQAVSPAHPDGPADHMPWERLRRWYTPDGREQVVPASVSCRLTICSPCVVRHNMFQCSHCYIVLPDWMGEYVELFQPLTYDGATIRWDRNVVNTVYTHFISTTTGTVGISGGTANSSSTTSYTGRRISQVPMTYDAHANAYAGAWKDCTSWGSNAYVSTSQEAYAIRTWDNLCDVHNGNMEVNAMRIRVCRGCAAKIRAENEAILEKVARRDVIWQDYRE